MRAAQVLILIGVLQLALGSSAAFTLSDLDERPPQRVLFTELLGGIGPLTMAAGAWLFRRARQRGFLWLTTGGTVLFGLSAALTAVNHLHDWSNLLRLLLPCAAVWMTAILWRLPL